MGQMMIRYELFVDEHLLIQKYSGVWSFDYYKKYADEILKNPAFNHITKILSDFTELDLGAAFEDVDDLVDFRTNTIKSNYYNVYVINDPQSTVVTHLFQLELVEKGFQYDYCTTLEKAMYLLKIAGNKINLEKKLQNLSHQFKP